MLANVTCPSCQHRFWLDEGQMGSKQTCPKCLAAFFAGKSTAEARAGAAPTSSAQPGYSKTMVTEAAPPIKYNCPRCKSPLEAEGIEAGTKKDCPNCTQRHQVPAAAKPAPAPPSPALNKTMLAGDESAVPPAPPIKYNCPSCKKPLEAPADQAGTKRNCPACNQRLQIPVAPPGAPNRNKTILAADESAGPAIAAQGTPSTNGAAPGAPAVPANPWVKALTPLNIAIGVIVLLLLVIVVPAVIRGGKSEDTEAVAKAQLDMRRLELEFEQKKLEFEKQEKARAEAQRVRDEEIRERRAQEEKTRLENQRLLNQIEDEDRRRAERKKQDQEREQRDRDFQARLSKYEQDAEARQKQLEQTKRDLEAAQQSKQTTQTIIAQPPVIYHPPYDWRYYRPWW